MDQLTLNLKERITTGKKNQRLSIPCSDTFLEVIDKQAEKMNTTRAELTYRFVLEGMQKAWGKIFMMELHGDKKLSDFIE
ncbi:hypothetical protein KAR91_42820 [Candidatus Pacearchaeota archaeon]|nr:hypothetical protein [Candidatus Pacearchaeota archaeon]